MSSNTKKRIKSWKLFSGIVIVVLLLAVTAAGILYVKIYEPGKRSADLGRLQQESYQVDLAGDRADAVAGAVEIDERVAAADVHAVARNAADIVAAGQSALGKAVAHGALRLADKKDGQSLGDYLDSRVFAERKSETMEPDLADVAGFETYTKQYQACLAAEKAAVQAF